MVWNLMFFINSILLGFADSVDAFSVSMANGLNDANMTKKKALGIASTFGIFQFVMPMIGWVCVHTIVEQFKAFEYAIPWIALALLLFIGGKMLIEGIKNFKGEEQEVDTKKLTFKLLFVQGIATSIDALSVGFTIAEYNWINAIVCALIIGIITFVICIIGVKIGKKFGTKLSSKANILGGVILIAIGIEIFVSGMISLYA